MPLVINSALDEQISEEILVFDPDATSTAQVPPTFPPSRYSIGPFHFLSVAPHPMEDTGIPAGIVRKRARNSMEKIYKIYQWKNYFLPVTK